MSVSQRAQANGLISPRRRTFDRYRDAAGRLWLVTRRGRWRKATPRRPKA